LPRERTLAEVVAPLAAGWQSRGGGRRRGWRRRRWLAVLFAFVAVEAVARRRASPLKDKVHRPPRCLEALSDVLKMFAVFALNVEEVLIFNFWHC
jgi:hypothetical protein